MNAQRLLTLVLLASLVIVSGLSDARASTVPLSGTAPSAPSVVEGVNAPTEHSNGTATLPPGVSTDWWTIAQKNIRQSEYYVTWQDHTYLSDVPAPPAELRAGAYQAPNRAQGLRTYFTPEGPVVIPRVWPEVVEAPPWHWGLRLTAWGREGTLQPVSDATLHPESNRIEYRRGHLTEWYINDERGLEQGFTLTLPPATLGTPPPLSQDWERREGLVLELALTDDLLPHLTDDGQAVEFTTLAGEPVLRYADLHATDATGRQLPAQFSIPHSQISILVDTTSALYPITTASTITSLSPSPTGLPPTADWTAEGDQVCANFGSSVSTAGDVNGDGYSDVIVGAPGYDSGLGSSQGRAFVYHGSASGLGTTADWTDASDRNSAFFGRSVSTAGDVNGDGFADVLIAANHYTSGETDEGWVFVYHGSSSGLSAAADWTAESNQAGAYFGISIGTAGDVNGDGYDDIIVGAYNYDHDQENEGCTFVWYGSATGLGNHGTPANADWTAESDQADANFGNSVDTAGDVNGDGYADVIVGAPHYDNVQQDEGAAFVYHGSASGLSTTADWITESNQTYASFGNSVGTAGDVNGDGFADVIVGAYEYDNGDLNEGQVFVYCGSATGLSTTADWIAEGNQENSRFGDSVSTAGDVNGDGYADVIVGAYGYNSGLGWAQGRVFVWYGGSSGLGANGTPDNADWTAIGDQSWTYFGDSVNTAGDVNGDGYADVFVGAPPYEGHTYVYHGSAIGPSTTPNWTGEGNQAHVYFGYSVSTAGDVNGDGYADVIVGAYDYDNGETNEGAAFVYHGSSSGISTTADWMAEGDQEYAWFGISVSTAGDVDGNGYADVIVGADMYDDGKSDEGAAFVYHGSATGLSATPVWMAKGNQASAYFGSSVSAAGDVNGDGYADVIVGAFLYDNGESDEGATFVYHGSATGLSAAPDWTAEGDQDSAWFSLSVSTAGDVNGDGYADVIVGAPNYDNSVTDEGAAFVYYGSALGLNTMPDWTAEGDQAGAEFGRSVSTAGDVNGDGYADVIVGAWRYDDSQTDEGVAFVYHGSAFGLSASANWVTESGQGGARFGVSVSTAGDVNGDGYADVIVGAWHYDDGQTDEGAAFAYHGSPLGLSTTADWAAMGDQTDAYFGHSVSTAGDVNGDGYADIIVGAFLYDSGETNEGRAFVYYGNGGDGLDLLPRQLRTDGSSPIAPLGMTDSATAVQLRLTGRMPLGREKVKLQWQVAPLGTPFDASTVINGTSAAWTDVLTTGVVITQNVTGLALGTPYHWRVRLLYRSGNRLGQPASRWVHAPWNGWTEQDFRTPNQTTVSVGSSPHGIAVNAVTNRIYVVNGGSNTVSVINGVTHAVAATVSVGTAPYWQIAVNPNTNRIYVSNNGGSSVSVIDGATNSVTTTIPLGGTPEGVAVHPGRNLIYATHSGDELAVIDGATNVISTTINTGNYNHLVTVNPDTDRAYVSKTSPGAVAVLDLATNQKITDVNVGGSLWGMAVNTATNQVYVTNSNNNAVHVIDGVTNSVVATITVGTSPNDVAVNPNANCVYVANASSNTVSIIDGETNAVLGTVSVGQWPNGIAANPTTGLVYVTNRNSGTVTVIRDLFCASRPTFYSIYLPLIVRAYP